MGKESRSGARGETKPQGGSKESRLTKSRWQLIVSGVLSLFWMAVLAWLAAGG